MSTKTTHRPPATRWGAISDNRLAVEAMLDSLPLPCPTLISRPDAVYVTVADVDDLGVWLRACGGTIRVSPEFGGVELWMLHTETPERTDGSTVAVRVCVPVLADESVMHDIRAAVKA
ncbi:hypothetical protein [Streptomyces violascens]|uniref:Uncharacterized protein n=1 Tax=Streptomyces violascens TaxID=67381 RepID=A0ABQ3QX57_9ACTN|nr:hypothetical protein [Streptomyces violascens]GGU12888.1 hypothetical protein GCM10010289_38150 [Streptomyces violascens]GHI41865.1 hypothetical protein Sviol_62730 [Streptomyces violascens]